MINEKWEDHLRFIDCIRGLGTIPILYPIPERKRKEKEGTIWNPIKILCVC